jgi:hypothetical protein
MALIDAGYSDTPPSFDIQAVQAGDAAEMVTRLTAAIAASPQSIADLQMAGAGAGPLWEAWLVRADTDVSITVDPAAARVVAAVAGNPTEARLLLSQRLAALNAVTVIAQVNKVVVAGGGVGPTYMAIALVSLPI